MNVEVLPPNMQNKIQVSDECWIWTGSRNKKGYGSVSTGKNSSGLAHRVSYELTVGPIGQGLTIDHLCERPACVNPAHLEPVTVSENNRRRFANKTHCPQGHAFDQDNTYVHPKSGMRECKTCRHDRWLKKRTELREGRRKAA